MSRSPAAKLEQARPEVGGNIFTSRIWRLQAHLERISQMGPFRYNQARGLADLRVLLDGTLSSRSEICRSGE